MKCILEGQLPDLSGKVDSIGAITQEQFDNLNYNRTMFGSIGPWITGHPRSSDYGIILLGAYSVDTNYANGMQDITYTNGDRYYRKAVNGVVSRWYKVATDADMLNKANVIEHSPTANGSADFDFDTLKTVGMHKLAGNFSAAKHRPDGAYGDYSVIVTGNDNSMAQIVAYASSVTGMQMLAWRKCGWDGDFAPWIYTATTTDLANKVNVGDVLPMIASLTTPAAGLDANNFEIGKMYCTNSAAESATVKNRPLEAQQTSLSSSAIFMIPANTSNNNYCVQFWIARWQLRIFFRHKDPGTEGSWGPWKEISMNTTPIAQTIPLSEGITKVRSATFWRNNVGEVTISAVLRGDIKNKDIIGTLPIGYRPSVAITIPCGTEIGGAREVVSAIDINLDGSLVYWGPTLSGTLGDNIYFNGSFPAIDI